MQYKLNANGTTTNLRNPSRLLSITRFMAETPHKHASWAKNFSDGELGTAWSHIIGKRSLVTIILGNQTVTVDPTDSIFRPGDGFNPGSPAKAAN